MKLIRTKYGINNFSDKYAYSTCLFDIDGNFDFWDMFGNVSLQRLDIDGLSHGTSHCKYEVCRAREVVGSVRVRASCILRGMEL